MKTIGVVAGLAWPSSIVYYKAMNELFAKRMGDHLQTPNLIFTQTNFALIEKAQLAGRWDEVGQLLCAEANKLKRAGADFFLLACNTVHTAEA